MSKPFTRRSATEFPMTPHGEAVVGIGRSPEKYSQSVIENPPRKLAPRFFVLHQSPTEAGGFDTFFSCELTVYEINETLPNPAEATVNFMTVVNGQIQNQNKVDLPIGIARKHWKRNIDSGWTELPKTTWPKWLKEKAMVK